MVTNLLHVHFCAVFKFTLIRLTKNGIQRFIPNVAWVNEGQRGYHREFHPFNWVCRMGSRVQIQRRVNRHCSHTFKNCFIRHALDWERDRAKIEFATKDSSTDLCNDILASIPIVLHDTLIYQWETTVFMRVR